MSKKRKKKAQAEPPLFGTSNNIAELEKRLWGAADHLRANSELKSSEYSVPVLGLIFLKYADIRFQRAQAEIESKGSGRRKVGKTDYQARGVMYLPEGTHYSELLKLPEGADIGKAINKAMKAIEAENEDLKDVLPKTYNRIANDTLVELLKTFNSIPDDIEGDAFGKIYEYFLGKFAMTEGRKGGEFFTPTSVVKLIVDVIEPYHGRMLDPACGSGGMFVQSAQFVERHQKRAANEISVFGCERVAETVRLCKMNLAVHGLSGDVRQANSYYEDPHALSGQFDFVMANPPFNVDKIDKEKIKDDTARFPFGMPRVDNGNYIWIQLFYSALNDKGRAGFVMANSGADARASELEIRKQLIESGVVDVIITLSPNFFYTVTLPVTLWFLDKGRALSPKAPRKKDTVLFIDARHIYHQIDRAHRDFLPEQSEFIANIVRLYRGEEPENFSNDWKLLEDAFPKVGKSFEYQDVPGLCKVATLEDIEAQGWSLNPGRYVGVAKGEEMSDEDFREKLEAFNEELEKLNHEARELEAKIAENVAEILDA